MREEAGQRPAGKKVTGMQLQGPAPGSGLAMKEKGAGVARGPIRRRPWRSVCGHGQKATVDRLTEDPQAQVTPPVLETGTAPRPAGSQLEPTKDLVQPVQAQLAPALIASR